MVPEELVKAFEKGDSQVIAGYFHDNIEMHILADVYITSKNQASRILQNFFKEYEPVSFKVNYEAKKADSKYGLGTLVTNKGTFHINLYFMEGKKEKIIYYLSVEKA
jgi:hypothetical protein